MDKDISTLLREIKSASGWSEPRIAAELGTSQPTVNRILNGQPDCKAKTLRSIDALHRVLCGRPELDVGDALPQAAVESAPQQQQRRRQSDQDPAAKSCSNERGSDALA